MRPGRLPFGRRADQNARSQKESQKRRAARTKDELPPELREKIPAKQIDTLWDLFRLFDANNDGFVASSELGDLMRASGENPIDTRLREMLEEVDIDGNEELDFGEFMQLWLLYLEDNDQEETMIRKAFEFFDKDGSGSISPFELKSCLTELGDALTEEEFDLFWRHVDKNGDGVLEYSEFLDFLKGERAEPVTTQSPRPIVTELTELSLT